MEVSPTGAWLAPRIRHATAQEQQQQRQSHRRSARHAPMVLAASESDLLVLGPGRAQVEEPGIFVRNKHFAVKLLSAFFLGRLECSRSVATRPDSSECGCDRRPEVY